MAAAGDVIKAGTVKDVSPHEFVKAYAAHLKRSGKVVFCPFAYGSGMWVNLIVPWYDSLVGLWVLRK